MPWTQGEFNVPNNFVAQYNAGQKKIRADLMDENFNDVAGAVNKVVTDYKAADTAAISAAVSQVSGSIPAPATATPKAPGTAAVGTSTKYAREDHVHAKEGSAVPIGTIVYFAKATAPDGYLVCNGGSYSSATYKALYDVIGTTFGGTTSSFKVPNLIDKVAWGNATVGTTKNAGLPNITGETVGAYYQNSVAYCLTQDKGALYGKTPGMGTNRTDTAVQGRYNIGFDASKSNAIYGSSTTVQPPALTLLPCIKH